MMKSGYFSLNLIVFVACFCICLGCSKKAAQQITNNGSEASNGAQQRLYQQCLDAAKKALGARAEIVKSGTFNNLQVQEAVAVLRTEHAPGTRTTGLDVSQLVIFRHEASGWKVVLTVSKQVQNEAGFVGIDYIDGSSPFHGYRVLFSDQLDDGKRAFTLNLSYLAKDGNTEGIPLEISWDDTVGRYREFNVNSDPPGFKPEIKIPPHLKH